ncbi:MAG: tetratricopeptide repeat protein [Alphaproteobacteria bacterium]|nr:tetratricopeptide repeat protein [Alphaproteobacteria bacterium]
MSPLWKYAVALAAAGAIAMVAPARPILAAGSIVEPAKNEGDYEKAVKAVKAEKYKDAIELLQKVVQKEPAKADAWNYLGYSQRKTGKYDDALKSYTRALDIDPKHKGAHEYVGELYLQTDNLPKAEEHLKILSQLCGSCEERKDLEKAVAAYKKAKGIG